mmetsp:Transcript_8205/g.15198  ORF Transcript_8205/g.15198 Transcript_8205/m.15198 type:complete len:827 (-) Transcript_8205:1281-3761(-)|eukprot:CAMPEP_0203747638 /NCGR_PEP_ID=MMETSP0098-20131031/2726_1 /ASSEMBLY_ACC=CAM_ASM_000208 /TAXON_ID=96639 /ORGANISM=" , Strain NY0313808BC1" /LENGTH=826 /DNA_ID=CAMNT_0050636119 /DNA_START=232 /DNA_END=2712 /DNA_ORIENTATION=-
MAKLTDYERATQEVTTQRRWLAMIMLLDVAQAVFFAFRTMWYDNDASQKESFALGSSIEDMSLWTIGRVAFFALVLVFLSCYNNKKGVRVELVSAMLSMLLVVGFWVYVSMKLLSRLINDGPFHPSIEWFWGCMVAQSILCTFEIKGMMTYLRAFVIYRVERKHALQVNPGLSETLLEAEQGGNEFAHMTPRARVRKIAEKKELFGSTFDWFYGRIGGVDAEEELDANEKEPKETNEDGSLKHSSTLVEMLKLTIPYWKMMIIASIALVIAAVGQALIPALTGEIINTVTQHPEDKQLLKTAVGKLLLAGLVTAIFSALRGSCFTIAKGLINMTLREKLFQSLLNQEVGFFDQIKSGKLNSRLNTDTTVLSDQVSLSVNVFSRSVVQAICVLVFMFRINVELSLATFMTVPAVAIVTQLYGDLIWHLYNEAQQRLANANAVSDAALTTMHNVRCFASEKAEMERYHSKMNLYLTLQIRLAICYIVYAIIFTLLPCVATALVLFYGGKLVEDDKISAGDLVSFMLYQQSLSQAINDIGSVFSDIAGALGAGDKVFDLINRTPKETPKGDEKPSNFDGTIEFKDVKFRYPARPDNLILDKVSLKINPGEVVALVGASGGGKSSILKIVERLYDIESGVVMLGGKPLDNYDHQYLHEKITIVGQEPVLYARSIKDNIKYGLEGTDDEPSFEQIVEAAKAANAHEFIMGFSEGYDTLLGDRGVAVSGGQKQRIAIARALVRSGDILLLDEATSALDAASEAMVQETIDKIMANGKRTCIIIAHRLSTVVGADRIIAMKEGRVVEAGTHEELLQKEGGLYKELVEKQMVNH